MIRVIIESPFAGDVEKNLRYLRAAMRDCLKRGETPFASHALYTQEGVLDDKNPEERALGIAAGFIWRDVAEKTVVYGDLGMSSGMIAGIEHAKQLGHLVEYRSLPTWAPTPICAACKGTGRIEEFYGPGKCYRCDTVTP